MNLTYFHTVFLIITLTKLSIIFKFNIENIQLIQNYITLFLFIDAKRYGNWNNKFYLANWFFILRRRPDFLMKCEVNSNK